MYHLTIAQLLIGAFVLILCIVVGVRAALEYRRENAAPFSDYFGPGYERDILQHSVFSESEDWLADRPSRFAPFHLAIPNRMCREPESTAQPGGIANRRD